METQVGSLPGVFLPRRENKNRTFRNSIMWWLDAQWESVVRKRPWDNMVMIHGREISGPEIIPSLSDSFQCSALPHLNLTAWWFPATYYSFSISINHCESSVKVIALINR